MISTIVVVPTVWLRKSRYSEGNRGNVEVDTVWVDRDSLGTSSTSRNMPEFPHVAIGSFWGVPFL